MSVIYNRVISVLRDVEATQVGDVGYAGGTSEAATTQPRQTILTDVPCSIQAQALGSTRYGSGVPGDAPGPTKWNVYIPKSANITALDAIQDDDVVQDEVGALYQVAAAYPTALGWKLGCIRIEN